MRLLGVLLATLVAGAGSGRAPAQTFPAETGIFVTDAAGRLDADTTRRLSAALNDRRTGAGVRVAVVLLADRSGFHPGDTLRSYSAALFDVWGMENDPGNDSALIVLLLDDLRAEVVIGSRYPETGAGIAREIAAQTIEPVLRADSTVAGLERAVLAGADAVALRLVPLLPPPRSAADRLAGMALVVALAAGTFGLWLGALWLMSLRQRSGMLACPACGRKGLSIGRSETTVSGWRTVTETLDCPSCGWSERRNSKAKAD